MNERAIPHALNYGQLKPQSVESQLRLSKFTPTSTGEDHPHTSSVRFLINDNGFWDPYNSYIKIRVKTDQVHPSPYIQRLDGSAHSLISTLIVRVAGQEIERIEHYDLLASILNDMAYSSEQRLAHAHEGFGTIDRRSYFTRFDMENKDASAGDGANRVAGMNRVGQRMGNTFQTTAAANDNEGKGRFCTSEKFASDPLLAIAGINEYKSDEIGLSCGGFGLNCARGANEPAFFQLLQERKPAGTVEKDGLVYYEHKLPLLSRTDANFFQQRTRVCLAEGAIVDGKPRDVVSCSELEFTIPILSGIFGILMPGDMLRYIPLSYFPNLEFEFSFNPHAFIQSNGDPQQRAYTIKKMEIYSNVLTFENDIHDALDNVVAQSGLHIVSQSFLSGPILSIPTAQVPSTFPIQLSLKSLKAIFFTFLYDEYLSNSRARKLNRCSHNLKQMQVRIGATAFFPSLPVEGSAGDSLFCYPFITEMYKAMGRLHDITTDTNISPENFCIDTPYSGDPRNYYQHDLYDHSNGQVHAAVISSSETYQRAIDKSENLLSGSNMTPVGRSVFGISMQNISSDSSTMSGVNTVVASPLEVLLTGGSTKGHDKPSRGYSFALHDFVLYIRPDLQIKILGR